MAFENLTDRLSKALKNLTGKGKIHEEDLQASLREIRLALLEADVSYATVKKFIANIKEKAKGAEILDGLNAPQQVVKIVNDELTALMGEEAAPLNKSEKIPTVIMMAGLQGAGKTTTVAKLAYKLKKEDKARPLMIAADVYRPAAIDQLEVLGKDLDIPVFSEGTDVDPREIVKHGLKEAKANKNDYVFIDTAGRLQIDEELMTELKDIATIASPDEILLTVDAMTGQNATETAQGFSDALDLTGVVLTKLDGDTRGGAALSIRDVTGKPIKFVGQGEKPTDLDVFYPDRMASRILGMGDMLTFIEKAQKEVDEKKQAEQLEKMRQNTFDFNDFVDQLKQVQNMGPMEDLMKMIPGMAGNPALQNLSIDPKTFTHMEAIVSSMTKQERENPDLLNPSRRRRLAAGAGRPIVEVNKMIKQFDQMKKMMNQATKGNFSGMEQMMGGAGMDMSSMMGGQGMPGGNFGQKVQNFAMKQAARKMKKMKKKRGKK
ncbi:signal recognition particle protein [Fructobacillus sp. M1-13]|uniref:Signal recognition particle protein n=1 Tax=Fructobacillus papyriferae TaxID=2713171 RepID=A0ABS5QNY7_9LACO|nr:signal recognition particle protein [Fructobacillus papyriferae]MBS9334863.1 signal recognition particle protein [Fructobacillus papyriferae]MCD2158853.1 signal recognition particle protein [Fructobacillus papyriferae]